MSVRPEGLRSATHRMLSAGQRSEVWIAGVDGGPPTRLYHTDALLIEAPNWSVDGCSLLLNGNGLLWRLDLDDPAELHPIEFIGLPALNNDHVLSADGRWIFMSAMDGHIYRGAPTGGEVVRVSCADGKWHFLHGVSPDATYLAYVEIDAFDHPGRLVVAPANAEPGTVIDVGPGHVDGPEWSPDGQWIYVNTEAFTDVPGHAQLARVSQSTGEVQRLVTSRTVDWFPHLSPDGRFASYLAFPPGTRGHPADLDVEVRLVRTDDCGTPVARYPVFGGQGTLNVNSWSPDSDRFAFVGYPR